MFSHMLTWKLIAFQVNMKGYKSILRNKCILKLRKKVYCFFLSKSVYLDAKNSLKFFLYSNSTDLMINFT